MQSQPRSLLALFAHPDDEAFATGGTLARYAAEGAGVALVCATRGEVGEIADPALATPETLGDMREAELRCAAAALGLGEVLFLGYRDSGMADTPANEDPRAFANAPAEEVVARLVGIIRRLRPQVLVTFDPNGGYGHPDHVAIHRHTVAAFHAAGDPARYSDQGAPWQPDRLYYLVIPRGAFRRWRERMAEAGVPDAFERAEEEGWGWPDDQIDVVVDVSGMVDAKVAALRCHRTQFGADHPMSRVPEALTREMLGREHFALAAQAGHDSPPRPARPLDDLFDGL